MTGRTVVAVISSYRPPPSLVQNVLALRHQVAAVVVADDGSGDTATDVLAQVTAAGADVLPRATNDGIAVTLNEGIRRARDRYGADWILTLDQDTTLQADYVVKLLDTAGRAMQDGLPLGAVSYAQQNSRPIALSGHAAGYGVAFDPMQSGLLIPTATLDRIGPLRDDLFIDWVDTEFNQRMRAAGLLVLAAEGTDIRHSLGDMRPLAFFGRPIAPRGRQLSVAYHPPVRAYYMARNGLLVARHTLRSAPRWTVSRLAHDAVGHAARVLVGPQRLELLLALVHGLADGIRGRAGKIPPATLRRLTQSPVRRA